MKLAPKERRLLKPRSFEGQRKFRNFLQKPSFQIRYGIYFICFGLVSAMTIQWLIYRDLRDAIVDFYLHRPGENILEWLDPTMVSMGHIHLMFFLAFSVISVGFGIYVTHKVVGPMVSLVRHVRELQKGNFASRVGIRSGDDMHELAHELNELAERLEKSAKTRRSTKAANDSEEDLQKAS